MNTKDPELLEQIQVYFTEMNTAIILQRQFGIFDPTSCFCSGKNDPVEFISLEQAYEYISTYNELYPSLMLEEVAKAILSDLRDFLFSGENETKKDDLDWENFGLGSC